MERRAHPHLGGNSAWVPHVPGRAHRKDAFIAAGQQHPFQKPAALIVKEVFIPFVFHQLGYDHDDAAVGMLFRKIENELNDGNDDEAVGRRQDMELGRLLAGRAEGLLDVVLPVRLEAVRSARWARRAGRSLPVKAGRQIQFPGG